MNADDLKDLYSSLRGSRSALAILDAQTLFTEKHMVKSLAKLQEAYDTYQESRSRLLKQDPEQQYDPKSKDGDKQIRRLKRKQEKAREIIEVFDDLLSQLGKLARRERANQPKEIPREDTQTPALSETKEPPQAKSTNVPEQEAVPEEKTEPAVESTAAAEPEDQLDIARPSSITERFLDEFQENWGDDQLSVIGRRYSFTAVESEDDIHIDALYFLHNGDDSLMVQTGEDESGEAISLINVVSKQPMPPLPRDAFVKLGRQRKMVLLLDRNSAVVAETDSDESAGS